MLRRSDLGNRQQWLAVGLLIGAIVLVYLLGLHGWWGAPMLELQRQSRELRLEEQRLRMHASQRPAIQARIAKLGAYEQNNPGLLPEATPELAMAGLMQRLENLAQDDNEESQGDGERCTIANRTTTPHKSEERFARVGIRVRMRCSIQALAGLLHALEGKQPQLFLDKLTIQGRGGSALPGIPKSGSMLEVNFDLYGYLRTANESGEGAQRD